MKLEFITARHHLQHIRRVLNQNKTDNTELTINYSELFLCRLDIVRWHTAVVVATLRVSLITTFHSHRTDQTLIEASSCMMALCTDKKMESQWVHSNEQSIQGVPEDYYRHQYPHKEIERNWPTNCTDTRVDYRSTAPLMSLHSQGDTSRIFLFIQQLMSVQQNAIGRSAGS